MGVMKKLIFVVAVMFALSSVASAAIITSVDRAGGASDDREPYGPYDGDDPVLASDPGGLADGVLVFSDRTYPYTSTPIELVGAEYIRTFNNDKNSASTVTYTVTTSTSSYYAIGIDDRWSDQQARIDTITAGVVPAGTFLDTGLNVYIREKDDGSRDRPLSVFMAELPAGTHVFSGAGTDGNNFMVMGAVIPEPATIALLGLGGLALIRKKR
jgi:hypothetical protein